MKIASPLAVLVEPQPLPAGAEGTDLVQAVSSIILPFADVRLIAAHLREGRLLEVPFQPTAFYLLTPFDNRR